MPEEQRSFTFEQTVPAPPAAVYRAFTNGTALREWFADVATVAPREGGRCYLAWNDGYYTSGAFTELQPEETVAFTWFGPGEPGASDVRVDLAPAAGGTHVRVTHRLGQGDAWQEPVAALQQAWPFSLENLASIFGDGADLRFTARPMLGVTVGDFDEAIAARLDVPVSRGVRLDGVVSGMGAAAAGLAPDDVIVAIDGREVVNWETMSNALQRHRAGDTVPVVFYRGPEKHEIEMALSGRPLPPMPQSLDALLSMAEKRYAETDAELEAFFEGVSEAEAGYKPAPDAWSAKEVLAHLIHGERGWHNYVAEMVTGHEPWYDDWGGNLDARVAATVRVYDTVPALLAELQRHNAESVALIANLPPQFATERKATFWRLAYSYVEAPYHHRTHLEQMEEAIAAARAA